jgi:hypothetical protein
VAVTSEFKRGDTFLRWLVFPDTYEDGYFLLWDVAAQLRTNRGKLIADLTVSWEEPAETTRALRLFAQDTTAWPLGLHELDAQLTRQSDSFIMSTKTVFIDIVRDVTQVAP